ncbi:MAG: hypothetical protein GC152_08815 [Alphaproteobacteria bacterium]|nr:hypothetical protein [Alphaproteobacteria bacterium]
MDISTAIALWIGVGAYLLVGVIVGGFYLLVGARRLDAAADGASAWFRLIALPGAAAVWPLLALRQIAGAKVDEASDDDHARALPASPGGTV